MAKINIIPDAQELWRGIGGHFDSLTQVLSEFIDNSISNFDLHNDELSLTTICIEVQEITYTNDKKYLIRIEDTGTGIRNIEKALTIGNRDIRETSLNEHGFGIKHALATADPDNSSWKIYTRTEEDVANNTYKVISSPYSFNMEVEEYSDKWPGKMGEKTGTIIEFICSEVLFNTLQEGIRGKAAYKKCIEYLIEDLGYVYADFIKRGINIKVKDTLTGSVYSVEAVKPEWVGFYKDATGTEIVDLGEGDVEIKYEYGEMKESKLKKYYKRNQSTSGLEIRINGRLIMDNVFKDVWGIEVHPSYNHFLFRANIISDDRDRLPITRTSKNSIKIDDDKLKKLYEWIRSEGICPKPDKRNVNSIKESELVGQLYNKKMVETKRKKGRQIEKEFKVFKDLDSPVPVDLYLYDGHETLLYEAKKDLAEIQSAYQLMMYWDGAVLDGLKPDEGIIVASSFSKGLLQIVEYINKNRTDAEGNSYKFSTSSWSDEDIKYPEK